MDRSSATKSSRRFARVRSPNLDSARGRAGVRAPAVQLALPCPPVNSSFRDPQPAGAAHRSPSAPALSWRGAAPRRRRARRRGTALAAGLSLIVAVGCAQTAAVRPPRFVEETMQAGLSQAYDGDWEFYVGGGVAVFDCNADGRPDLFVAGGQNAAALYRNDSLVRAPPRLPPP